MNEPWKRGKLPGIDQVRPPPALLSGGSRRQIGDCLNPTNFRTNTTSRRMTGTGPVIISAMSRNRLIGSGDGMPWDVPEEYSRYVDTVRDATVIFGRKSYEIFANDLDAARCIVVTNRSDYDAPRVANSLPDALRLAEADGGRVFIAGGASIYEQGLPLADRMYLSIIHGEFEGDTYFPEFDKRLWTIVREENHERYDFYEYARADPR